MDEAQRKIVLEKLEKALYSNVNKIPLFGLHRLQQVIPYQVEPTALLDVTILGDVSRLDFIRDSSTGELLDLNEEPLHAGDDFHYDLTSKSSVSMKRCATSTQTITGSITSLPFKPPALDLVDDKAKVDEDSVEHMPISDFLKQELTDLETTIPGTNVKNSFDCEEPDRDALFKLDDDDNKELLEWISAENARYDCLGSIIESANQRHKESTDDAGQSSDPKKDKASEKEMNKLVNRILNISIKDIDLEEDKSSEFAKVVNIAREPDEEIANPAKTYDFKLDPFQKQAILHMEKFCNVFVAAHTSAGKTVVAEYAIAMARRSMTKVVYTSPIKALSNQKYRDFTLEFGDVGLITGDVQVNTDASCLILTTEILLQMLDNGSDLIRDLEWAIFDEVHYVNDEERGHVWERIFIMLPEHVNLVLLSATVPNVIKFAEWLGRIRKKPTVVITTAKRPVPLEHYLYTGSSAKTMDQRYKFIDHASNFVLDGYKRAIDAKKDSVKHVKGAKGKSFYSNPQQDKNIYVTLVRHLENLSLLPVICFTFSRRRCDANARMLQSLDLTTGEEKARIHKFVTRSLDRFKESDRKLRQVVALKEMLKRGFGVHHSGVLPLLKEITEILFCDGLVKVLFATETFAMGVNMPARSVVFDSIKKHDGRYRRYLLPSEYIQMAGRAGRRGKDSVGTVIVLCKKEVPEASDLINIALGKPMPLESRFQLKYSMILTLLRARHHLKVESVIGKSFIEHDKQASLASEQVRQQALLKKIDSFRQPDCDMCLDGCMDDFCEYYLRFMTTSVNEMIRIEIFTRIFEKKKIIQGKTMCLIGLETNPVALGVIVQVYNTLNPPAVEVLYLKDHTSGKVEYNSSLGYHQILFVLKDTINSNWIELNKERDQLQRGRAISKASQQLRNYLMKLQSPLELLNAPSFHPYTDLNLRDLDFVEAYDKYDAEQAGLKDFGCWSCTQFIQHFQLFFRKHHNLYEVNRINFLLSPESLFFLPEYKRKLEVGKVEYNSSLGYHQILFVLKDTINSNWIELNKERDQLQRGRAISKASQQLRNYLMKLQSPLELLNAPSFHPYTDLNLRDLDFVEAYDKYDAEQAGLKDFGCWSCTQFIQHFQLFFRKHHNLYEVNRINFLLSPESLFFLPEYKRKLEVLRVLNYINEENVPELKAKVACLMSVHELVITEMLTENMLSDCTPAEIAALLSVFVYQQKQREEDIAEKEKKPTTRLERKCLELVKIAENVGKIQRECGLEQTVEDFVDTLKFGLVDVVHKWAEGSSFSELLKITEEQEGIIVRCIQRLDEVLRAVKAACKLIGYPDICERIEIANQSINRDIVFAASLYVCSLQPTEEEQELDGEPAEEINQEAIEQAALIAPEDDAALRESDSE